MIRQAASFTIVVLLAALCLSCGASQRDRTVKATFVALKAAHVGFVEWDTARQDAIITEATSYEEGQAKLKAFRAGKTEVYETIALGLKLLLDVAVAGDADSLDAAIHGAAKAIQQINEFKESH